MFEIITESPETTYYALELLLFFLNDNSRLSNET